MEQNAIYIKRVLNSDEAAEFLGISKRTLWNYTSSRIVPFSKPTGKQMFFDRLKLEEWMLQNQTLSSHEREALAVTHTTKQ